MLTSLKNKIKSILCQQTSVGKYVEKGNSRALLGGMQAGAAPVENSMEVPQKTRNGFAF